MKQNRITAFVAVFLLFSCSFQLTAQAVTKEIAVTYKWLGRKPRFDGGYVALEKATPEQQAAFAGAVEAQIATQTGLVGDGSSVSNQIAKQLMEKSAVAITIPAGTTMTYMGSGKGTVFGHFTVTEPLAGHAFALKLQDAGQNKYVGTLRVFDKCANELPLEFSAVPVESPRPEPPTTQVPPVKKVSVLFEGGYRNNVNGKHQLERGYLGIGTKVGEKTRVYVGGGFIGSQAVESNTITICN
ncbi:MAG: hypothetical protein HGB18_00065 [Candidatus Moranbacteria bacterium]|nr:hypothetical protein [Candidatus Moranbacteria bacterium]